MTPNLIKAVKWSSEYIGPWMRSVFHVSQVENGRLYNGVANFDNHVGKFSNFLGGHENRRNSSHFLWKMRPLCKARPYLHSFGAASHPNVVYCPVAFDA